MSDRERLELAAKAAGIVGEYYKGNLNDEWVEGIIYIREDGQQCVWNPLTDGGDALWLSVKLELDIYHSCISVRAIHRNNDAGAGVRCKGKHPQMDPYTATRRAIVRAAAEIGRNMK